MLGLAPPLGSSSSHFAAASQQSLRRHRVRTHESRALGLTSTKQDEKATSGPAPPAADAQWFVFAFPGFSAAPWLCLWPRLCSSSGPGAAPVRAPCCSGVGMLRRLVAWHHPSERAVLCCLLTLSASITGSPSKSLYQWNSSG